MINHWVFFFLFLFLQHKTTCLPVSACGLAFLQWWVSRSFQPAREEERVQQIPVCTPVQTSRGISCQWPWPHTSSPPLPGREETQQRGTFQISHHTTFFFNQLSVFILDWFLSNGWFFHYEAAISLNVSQSLLVSLMKNSRSNYWGPIVSQTGLYWLEIESVL